jgi:hypothetical protein
LYGKWRRCLRRVKEVTMTNAEKNAKLDELEAAIEDAALNGDRDEFEGYFAEYMTLAFAAEEAPAQ